MSVVHSLIRRVVAPLSGRTSASSGLYVPSTYQYDYALGGVPFMSGASDSRPDTEGPVPQRKDQFDNYKDPGEYSLNQWWLRSQNSFVGGAGVVYQDPDTQGNSLNIRYASSIGVDPFSDADILSLLHRVVDNSITDADAVNSDPFSTGYSGASGNDLWFAKGRTITSYSVSGNSLVTRGDAVIPAGTGQITKGMPVVDKTSDFTAAPAAYVFYADFGGASTNGIYKIVEGTPPVATRIYVMPDTIDYDGCLTKAKGLLAYGRANKLYMLDPYAAVDTALPTENAQVPADQFIVDVTDGPDGVYVASNSGTQGYIYKSTFDSAGIVNGLSLIAVMPNGERINNIAGYVGTYIVITTETGIRTGLFNGGGITYSPPIITTGDAPTSGGGFGRIAFWKDNAYVAVKTRPQHDGSYGLMAVNLSTVNNDNNTGGQFNAYSTWTYLPGNTNSIKDVTVLTDGRTVQVTRQTSSISHVMVEHNTELLESGYLITGRCRFNTVEPKLFKYFSVRTPTPLDGELAIDMVDDHGNTLHYITYGPTLDPGTDDVSTPIPTGPHIYMSLKFTLYRNASDLTIGGELDSWQIKALPGTLKQREIIRNFLCFNNEKDRTGNLVRGDTQALDKLTAIRQMCQRGDTVTLQDLAQNISDQVIIDDYQFTMPTTPGPNSENYGGYLTVKLRTVADSVPPISVSGDIEVE